MHTVLHGPRVRRQRLRRELRNVLDRRDLLGGGRVRRELHALVRRSRLRLGRAWRHVRELRRRRELQRGQRPMRVRVCALVRGPHVRPGRVWRATGVDWTQVRSITLNVNHIDLDGTPGLTSGVMLTESMPAGTVRVYGCAPHIVVDRNYTLTGGTGCSFTDTVMTESIAIPGATPAAGGCTAPAL